MVAIVHLRGGGTHLAMLRILLAGLVGCLACPHSFCLDRDRTIAQFYHTAWTANDGAPSQITALTQTADGYLWIGSQRGLFQFDGMRFKLFDPPAGVRFPSSNINSLMATPDGGLWVSFNPSGVGFLKDGRFVFFEQPRFELATFVRDLDGRIWEGTRTGLLLFNGARWQGINEQWNFSGQRIWTMFVDRSGTLWVAADKTLAFLRRGSKNFQQTAAGLNGVPQIAQALDGQLWISQWDRPITAIDEAGRTSEIPKVLLHPIKFLFDRDGSLWMVGLPNGVARLRFPERIGERPVGAQASDLEWFTESQGLTANWADNVFEDREGNIWVTSNKGLDRFRRSRLVPVMLPSNFRNSTLEAGSRGDVWIGGQLPSPFLHVLGEKIVAGTVPTRISSVYRESLSNVWWGARGGLWRQHDDKFDFFPQPKRLAIDWVWEVFPDDRDGGLWVALGDFGLIHFKDGIWTFPPKPDGLPDLVPSASFHDATGHTWLGYTDGRVAELAKGQVRVYSQADGIDVGRIRVIRSHGNQTFVGGELGLAVLEGSRFFIIHTTDEKSFGAVTGIVHASDGSLWLNEQRGIVRIAPSDVSQLATDPRHAVLPDVFDFLDGLPGAPQIEFRCSTAIQATDGKLWFATDNGLAWIDPAHIDKNTVPPPVAITALDAESRKYAQSGPIDLPQGTKSLRIDYTALSFSIPERVRFRYKLQGVENNWHDAGARREATYNNLGPGHYEFRVIAANNDGLWNEEGSALAFSIAPEWFQTIWFRTLCIAALFLMGWTLYQIRLEQIERQLKLGLETRINERTRIARELHDTLLQSFHGLLFQFQAARNLLPQRTDEAMRSLDDAINEAETALTESRDAIQGLRSRPGATADLAQLLADANQHLAASDASDQGLPAFSLVEEGEHRLLSPKSGDEVCRIALEILRNAIRHAHATRIEAEIRYDELWLRLRIRDNGIGINPGVLKEGGRPGHWGLRGIRERAERIGATLDFWSESGAGTEVQLAVPAALAYETLHERHASNWFRRAKNRAERC